MELKIGRHQATSEVWQMVQEHYTKRLDVLRRKLENPNNPESERTGLIHRIDEIKRLLAAAKPDAENVTGAGG